jgi:SAM-dependent methyltransferase
VLKRIVKGAFRAVGLELRRARMPSPTPTFTPVDPGERRELEGALEAFARLEPRVEPWSDPEQAREYLSDRRLRFFHDLLDAVEAQGVPLSGTRVADVGSGTGYLLRKLHRRYPQSELTGYDTYPEITRLARHLCPAASFAHRDLYDLEGTRFHAVFCTEVLEHLFRPAEAVQRLLGLLEEGGVLVLTVPDGRADSFPALEPLENGRGHWGHVNFWSPESWPLFLERAAPGWPVACGQVETGENWAVLGPLPSPAVNGR